jgi:hypothetical protein
MSTAKFKALVHYVVESSDDPQRLGATRLNKILWFADTTVYRKTGAPITGEAYVKRQRGPVPKTILKTLRELEQEGKIHIREKEFAGYRMRLFTALEEADKSLFSPVELEVVDSISEEICGKHTANSISELSHDQIWAAAKEGEEIPLYATLASRQGQFTGEIAEWADSVVEKMKANHQHVA